MSLVTVTVVTRHTLADYGEDFAVPGAVARFGAIGTEPAGSRPIESAVAYVAACRRLSARLTARGPSLHAREIALPALEGEGRIDGRLVAAGWNRRSPRQWVAEGGMASFLGYWQATQGRPAVVGSPYNDDPEDVAALWAMGVPVRNYPRGGGWLRVLTPNRERAAGHGIHARLAAVITLSRAFRGQQAPWLVGRASTADLRRLAKLSPAFLRALAEVYTASGYDWDAIAQHHAAWVAAPRHIYAGAMLPASQWLRVADGALPILSALAAVRAAGWDGGKADREWAINIAHGNENEVVRRLDRIRGRGWIPAFSPIAVDHLIAPLAQAAAAGLDLPTAAWASASQLREALDALGCSSHAMPAAVADESTREARRAVGAQYRALDRLAQRSPAWAIRQYRHEYDRGRRVAGVIRATVAWLAAQPDAIVVHGRDGELIYEAARRLAPTLFARMAYVVSSRALTTHKSGHPADYLAYLRRQIPAGALHTDTGFAGSIPSWVASTLGVPVARIAMISATDPVHQIPVPTEAIPAYGLRECVLADLEHSCQRLEEPQSWGDLRYSPDAPGFWARLYGVVGVQA